MLWRPHFKSTVWGNLRRICTWTPELRGKSCLRLVGKAISQSPQVGLGELPRGTMHVRNITGLTILADQKNS